MLNKEAQAGKLKSAANDSSSTSIRGVSILEFLPQSPAQQSGLQKRDVIVRYDGRVNLTTRKLTKLARMTMLQGIRPRVVVARDGYRYAFTLPPGSLGISAVDATVRGFLINREADPETSSIERLVQFMKSELADSTPESTLRRTLITHGWDKKEAALFVKQIADEMKRDPKYVRRSLSDYKGSVKWILLLTGLCAFLDIPLFEDVDDAITWVSVYAALAGACLLFAFCGWFVNFRRLKRFEAETEPIPRQAILFRPTKGNLEIAERCRSWVEVADETYFTLVTIVLVATVVFGFAILVIIMLPWRH